MANPNIIPLNDACLTAATGPPPAGSSALGVCSHRDGTPANDATGGWLQLTDKTFNRTGGMVYNQALPANAGLQAEFSTWQFGGGQGVGAADGVSFFLVDGSVDLDSVGAYGGSLGYAQKNDAQGVNGGYVGVGLDSYGNFANDSENRGSGCPAFLRSPVTPDTALVKNAAVIRGPMRGNRGKGYCYLKGTVNLSNNTTTLSGSLRSQDQSNAKRTIRVTVSPDQFPTVTVEIDFTGAGNSYQTVLSYQMQDAAPLTWKFGFAASTGGGNDVHLVRTPKIQTVNPLPPGINLVKQVDRTQQQPPSYTAGDTVPYQFVVTNTALAPLTNVTVTDPRVTNISCPATSLGAAGTATASMTCTGSHLLTAADASTALTFTNTATATGISSGRTVSAESSVTVPLTAAPHIAIRKSAHLNDTVTTNNAADVGETIDYSFLVTNAGNVPLTAVGVTDSKLGAVSCPATTLAPLATTTCTGRYTVTQADVDAGIVHNSATAHGKPPTTAQIVSQPSTADVPTATAEPEILLTKTATLHDQTGGTPGLGDLGEHISYGFVVTNAGNVTLTSVAVADATVGTVSCAATTLAPKASTTCNSATDHVISAADVDRGHVVNSATTSGQPPSGAKVTSDPARATVPTVAPNPQLTIVKTATLHETTPPTGDQEAVVGDTISYTFVVSNVGNVGLTQVGVTDPLAGTVQCDTATLLPGASTNCRATADHTVTQADVDNGEITNTATAHGTAGIGAVQSLPDSATVPTQKQAPQITISKTATPAGGGSLAELGDTVNYTFLVTNTGNVTLHNVGVTDSKVATVSCPATTLAPQAQTTCAATYTVTQTDVDAGEVLNTATSHGTPPGGTTPIDSEPDDAVVPTELPTPQIAVVKHAQLATDANGNALANPGDQVTYTFTVTNAGNVTLHTVSVTDPKAGATTCAATTLAPHASTACTATATYTVTQADVDHGSVDNTATAHGTPPTGSAVTATDSATVPTPIRNPRLLLEKSATLNDIAGGTDGFADVGETIDYTFRVLNIGNVTITDIAVTDDLAGTVTCDVTTLAPLGVARCAATDPYTVTQADFDAGVIHNTATAAGAFDGDPVTSNPDSTDTFSTEHDPIIAMTKTATLNDGNGNNVGDVGETITYGFTVFNTGNVTLTDVGVTDAKAGPVTCTATTLAPHTSTACTADNQYQIVQADVDAGSVDNTATAHGTPPTGGPVDSDPASASVPTTPQAPGLSLTKAHTMVDDPNGNGIADVGDTIRYTFIVTNSGTVTMTDIGVTDAKVGAVTCDDDTLAPSESTNCVADAVYTVTQADVDAGAVHNTATPSGTAPGGDPFTGLPVDHDVPTTQPVPSLILAKDATLNDTDGSGGADVGETIDYSFVVTNNGNVTISGITVSDALAAPVTCDATTLAPSAATDCTSDTPYPVVQSDVDARAVRNTATAAGTDPAGDDVASPPARAIVPTSEAVPGIVLVKLGRVNDTEGNGNIDGLADAGETITYVFVVYNSGNVTLSGVNVTDDLLGTVTCQDGVLAPQALTTCTAADHTVTQDDVDTGNVTNTATVVGIPARGAAPVSDQATEIIPTATPNPSLVLAKQGVLDDAASPFPGLGEVGEQVFYLFTVTNNGNVTVHGITISDPTVGDVTCDVVTLAPAEQTTCRSVDPHTITQADVDTGGIDNTATAHGFGPPVDDSDGAPVTSDPAQASVPTVEPRPGLGLTKAAHLTDLVVQNGVANLGDTVTWTFTVVNTGNVTLTDISVTDSKAGAVTCEQTTLVPGASTTCAAATEHVVTVADIETGPIVNVATATGQPPTGSRVTSPQAQAVVPTAPAVPRLFLIKEATLHDGNGNGRGDLGETISYTFLVVNIGTATATDVHLNDSMFGGPIACTPSTLKPAPSIAEIGKGQTATCGTHTHTVTEADINAPEQFVHNSAVAVGKNLAGGAVHSLPSVADVPLSRPTPTIGELVLTKSASSATVIAGDALTYTLTVTNTGDALLSGTVTDDLSDVLDDATLSGTPEASAGTASVSGTTLTWTGSVAGESVVTITYAVTVDTSGGNGVLANTAALGSGSCADGSASCSTSTAVEGESMNPPGELPNTGAPIQDWTLLGSGLLMAGVALVLGGRRRVLR